jgi:hypothetical protein
MNFHRASLGFAFCQIATFEAVDRYLKKPCQITSIVPLFNKNQTLQIASNNNLSLAML